MKKVDILQTTNTGQVLLATITVEDGKVVVLSGNEHAMKVLGIIDGPIIGRMGKKFFPKDGIKFLRAMKWAFSGSVIRASGVVNDV